MDEQDGKDDGPAPRQHTSLTHRLSSLYETLLSKAAPKKTAAPGQANPPATDPETKDKDGNVVYAELDLNMKTEGSPAITGGSAVRMTKEDATEYAEILPTQPASSPKAE